MTSLSQNWVTASPAEQEYGWLCCRWWLEIQVAEMKVCVMVNQCLSEHLAGACEAIDANHHGWGKPCLAAPNSHSLVKTPWYTRSTSLTHCVCGEAGRFGDCPPKTVLACPSGVVVYSTLLEITQLRRQLRVDLLQQSLSQMASVSCSW